MAQTLDLQGLYFALFSALLFVKKIEQNRIKQKGEHNYAKHTNS